MVRPQRPLDAKLRPRRAEQHKRRGRTLLNQQLSQFQRRGIGPVQIFGRHHEWLSFRKSNGPRQQRGEQSLALLVWCQRRGRIPGSNRQFQKRRDQRHNLVQLNASQHQRGF
jgi:hypothetical protein